MKPLISVIVPIYNSEKYLKKCINSIISQTLEDLEIILVNDGSTDKSGEICDDFAKIDERIKVIHKSNKGVSSARNKGIDIAQGHYIGFVDSDDWIDSTMYEKLYKYIIDYKADIAISGYIYEDLKGNIIRKNKISSMTLLNQSIALEMLLSPHYFQGYLCNKLFNSNLFNIGEKIRLQENIYISEDLLCVCQCILKSQKIVFIDDFFYHYVFISNSALNTSFNYKAITILDAVEQLHILISNSHTHLLEKVSIISAYSNIYIIRKIIENNCFDPDLLKKLQSNLKIILKAYIKSASFPMKLKIAILITSYNPQIFVSMIKLKNILGREKNYE